MINNNQFIHSYSLIHYLIESICFAIQTFDSDQFWLISSNYKLRSFLCIFLFIYSIFILKQELFLKPSLCWSSKFHKYGYIHNKVILFCARMISKVSLLFNGGYKKCLYFLNLLLFFSSEVKVLNRTA